MMRRVQALLGIFIILAIAVHAREMKPLEGGDLIVVEREVEAPTVEDAKKEAARSAVQSCVGRVYFSQKLMMARSLLEKYVDQYYDKFVYSVVTEEKKHYGYKVWMNLKVFVNYTTLMNDLEEKGFIFNPRIKPFYVVFLEETLDGEPAPYSHGRDMASMTWKDITGQRNPENEITIPPPNMDITETPALKAEAIRATQKAGAEVIITGTSSSVQEERKELYYDTYTFYRTTVHLKLIRADTGEILKETEVSSIAGSTRKGQAVELSITRAARKAATRIAEYYIENWDPTVLNESDYLFMFTGITDDKIEIIKKRLDSLSDDAEVYVRSRYSDVAVVNLVYDGAREKLIDILEESAYPRMLILKEEENSFEIQIMN